MNDTIFSIIRAEENAFLYEYINPVEGWSFNQFQTIKRAHLYLNSKFENGGTYLGKDLIFYNIVVPPCEVAKKMLNIDTKNIRLWPLNPKSKFSAYLLEKELKLWLKTSEFYHILNDLAYEAPRFGSVVLEKKPGGAEVVDLRRLMLDPTVERIQDSRFVTTIHYMTPSQLRETGWDNVEKVIEKFGNTNTGQSYMDGRGNLNQMQSSPYIKVYKRYGEVPERMLNGGKSEKMVRALFIVAGADQQEINEKGDAIGEMGEILFSSKWTKEWPFRDFHYNKTKGRWLGVGIVEALFDIQLRVNELKNQKRFGMELSNLHIFQTPDKQIVRNVLTDLEQGDLVLSKNGITPIANEERNLQAFDSEEASYHGQVDRLSFAYEAIRGENPDASTPLGTTQIAVAQSTGVYAFKKQNLANMLREFFNDLVIQEALKELSPAHIMRFTGTSQEMDKLDMAVAEIEANDYAKELMLSGEMVTKDVIESFKTDKLKELKKMGEARFLKTKDAFYDDTEFEFDFLITDEQADPMKVVQNTQAVFMALAQNPAMIEDSRIKLLFYKYADALGVSSAEIELAEQQAQQMPAQLPVNPTMQNAQQPPQPAPLGA